jgi:hypothetical protein
MKDKQKLLARHIRREDYQDAMDILQNDNSLDVTFKEGTYFIMAIEANNHNFTKALLDYYKEHQLKPYVEHFNKFKENTSKIEYAKLAYQYISLEEKLKGILAIAIEDVELTSEMQKVLEPYLDFSNNNHDQDFDVVNDDVLSTTGEDTEHSSVNSDILKDRKDSLSSHDGSLDHPYSRVSNAELTQENLRVHTSSHNEETQVLGENVYTHESEGF